MSKKTKDKPWTKEEDNFLIKNNHLHRKELAEKLKRTESSVQNRCRMLNLKRTRVLINETQTPWTEEELKFLKDNYYKYSRKELAKKLGRTPSAIQNKANRMGLKKDKIQQFNKNYFDCIDCNEKAYWLGFIYADGWVEYDNQKRVYTLGIELSYIDSEHLIKFNNCLNGNVDVRFRERQSYFNKNKIDKMCNIKFYSKNMIESLSKYNIVPNKTYKKDGLPNIPNEYMISFLHGYIDGDGSFFCKNYKNNKKYYAFNITSANDVILNDIRKYLYDEYNIKSYISISRPIGADINKVNVYQLTICAKESVNKFAHMFLNDNYVYLDRKYDLIQKYIASLDE